MLCWTYKRLLIGYAECELDERRRARVEAHMSRCPGCREELAAIRSVSSAIKSLKTPAMEPAPDLWAKVSARIERESAQQAHAPSSPLPTLRKGGRGGVTQAISACAAAVLVAAIGIGLMRTNLPPEQSQVKLPPPPPAVKAKAKPVKEKSKASPSARPVRRPAPRWGWIAHAPAPPPSASAGTTAGGDRAAGLPAAPPAAPTAADGVSVLADRPPATEPERLALAGRRSETPAPAGETSLHIAMKPSASASSAEPGDSPGTSHFEHADADSSLGAPFGTEDDKANGVADGPKSDEWHYGSDMTAGLDSESVVDALNKTEGVRTVALFTYP